MFYSTSPPVAINGNTTGHEYKMALGAPCGPWRAFSDNIPEAEGESVLCCSWPVAWAVLRARHATVDDIFLIRF